MSSQFEVDGWFINGPHSLDQDRLEQIARTLEIATETRNNADPRISSFCVGCALRLSNNTKDQYVSGSNFEYGGDNFEEADTRGLHAEESAVSTARQFGLGKCNTNNQKCLIDISAVISNSKNPVPTCGNCLDILKIYSSSKTLLVSGTTVGNEAIIHSFEDCLPTSGFQEIELTSLDDSHYELYQRAETAAKTLSFDLLSRAPHGKRGAAVLTKKGIYAGAHVDQADYHPTSAIRSAITNAYSNGSRDISALFYVSSSGYIPGKDRQTIFEITSALGLENLAPIYMLSTNTGKLSRATPQKLLPFGFSAKDLGLEGEVREEMDKFNRG